MTHPGQGNPDILEPAGPIDPQVGVLGAWSTRGKFLGCVVNFACHGTTGPGGISADWIYYLEKTIRGLMGDKAVVVFVQGTSGDITQVDNRSPYQIKQFGEISARYVGGRVGAEAIKTLLAIEQTAGPLTPIAARPGCSRSNAAPAKPQRVARALKLVQQDPSKVNGTEWTFAKEIVVLDAQDREGADRRRRGAGRAGRAGRVRYRARRSISASTDSTSRPAAGSPSPSRCRWPTAASATCRPKRRCGLARRRLRNAADQLQQSRTHRRPANRRGIDRTRRPIAAGPAVRCLPGCRSSKASLASYGRVRAELD